MAALIVEAAIVHIQDNLESQKLHLDPLIKVLAVLEGAEEGSRIADLAVDYAKWTKAAKKTLQVIEELRDAT